MSVYCFILAQHLVVKIVQHALFHIFMSEISAEKSARALLRGDPSRPLDRRSIEPLTIFVAFVIERQQSYSAHLCRLDETDNRFAVAERAESPEKKLLLARRALLIKDIHHCPPRSVFAGVLIIDRFHYLSSVCSYRACNLSQAKSRERQKACE